jgi:hypothetical protein
VYSQEREMAMYAGFDRALRTRLQFGAAQPIEFYTEYLDLMRFAEPLHRQQSVDFFRVKYAGPRIDLIVAVGSLAFDFILENGDEIFPGVPVVFASVNVSRTGRIGLKPNMTGVAVKRDIRQTLDLILTVQPDTQQIIVPVGSSPTERMNHRSRECTATRRGSDYTLKMNRNSTTVTRANPTSHGLISQ